MNTETYIYVIKSPIIYKDEYGITRYRLALKIGYTSDWERRWDNYNLHNPAAKVLFKINGGTSEDELKIKRYFRGLGFLVYREEWFDYKAEVLNFFKNNKTIEEIRISLSHIITEEKVRVPSITGIKKKFLPYIYSVISIHDNLCVDEFCKQFFYCKEDEEDVLKMICDIFPDTASSILQTYEDFISISDKRLLDFINTLKDTSKKVPDRLRLLCETPDFTDLEKEVIAKHVSLDFDRYYNQLGVKRCKALGYRTERLNKELSDRVILDTSSVKDMLLVEFKVGIRYKKSDIKETLKTIYSKLGLTKTAKANDLEEYFEIKSILVTDPVTKKRDNGFEIIKIKE